MQGVFTHRETTNVNWNEVVQTEKKETKSKEAYAADLRFFLPTRKQWVYIIDDDVSLRAGEKAHMLVPYCIKDELKRPINEQKRLNEVDNNNDYTHEIDLRYFKRQVHYITPDDEEFMEIGKKKLYELCFEAEKKDWQMALNMQGMLGTSLSFVWTCINPDYEPTDRLEILKTFLLHKQGRKGPKHAVSALIQEHKAFCKEWVQTHYKNITPIIQTAAVVTVRKCLGVIPQEYAEMGVVRLARLLWRNDHTNNLFQECVYWQINSTDLTRNGRNPSYKQMNTISHTHVQYYYKLVNTLRALNWKKVFTIDPQDDSDRDMNPDTIDWYDIVGQIPDIHHKFPKDDDSDSSDSDEDDDTHVDEFD